MPKDEDDESTSDEDIQTEYHIYHEDSTDTESIDSENRTFEMNDESIQPILSEIISAEPIEASPQSVHLEDNITLRGDDDQPQPEPEEQLGRGHRDRRLPIKLDDYVLSNYSEDYGLLSYQQAISGEEKNSKPQERGVQRSKNCHYGIAGNEPVDSAAKEAAAEAVVRDMYIRADHISTLMKDVIL
ncbi:hypothetical protein JTB14_028058 [Gonioctena quinquepunctata]|nr:hypothetical protein JTB14_028058 [Gonioctena quinquepunctata]